MGQLNPLEALTETLLAIVLLVASIGDLRSREIDDKVWLYGSIPLVVVTGYRLWIGDIDYRLYAINVTIGLILALVIWVARIMGEADAIAMVFLGLFFPPKTILGYTFCPLPIITVLANSILAALIYTFYNIYVNIRRIRGKNVFSKYDSSLLEKLLAIISMRYISREEYHSKPYAYMPSEKETGGVRKIVFNLSIGDESMEAPGENFWAVVYLPFIFFMLLGYILTLVIGCPLDFLLR